MLHAALLKFRLAVEVSTFAGLAFVRAKFDFTSGNAFSEQNFALPSSLGLSRCVNLSIIRVNVVSA